jgi:hypothetical protein
MRYLIFVVAGLSFVSVATPAAENPWVGSWKLDPSKSQL